MNNLSRMYPKWQHALREAAQNLNTNPFPRTDADLEALNARAQDRSQGRDLLFVLMNIFGIPVEMLTLNRNYYTVDGFWFALKFESVPGEDDAQPVHAVTSNSTKSQAAVTFTLWVGKVEADPAYPNWPHRYAIVGRNVHLYNTGYARLRAEMVEVLDALESVYQAEVPRYQAWKALELDGVSDAAVQQDYFLQLIRRWVRRLPAAEVLPVALPAADEADAIASTDGMLPAARKEFDGYDVFDPDDEPDNLEDDDYPNEGDLPDLDDNDDDDEPDDEQPEHDTESDFDEDDDNVDPDEDDSTCIDDEGHTYGFRGVEYHYPAIQSRAITLI